MARRKRRYRKKRYPRAYARMTWRGPRVGVNWMPGCLVWLVALAVALAVALVS